MRVVVCDTYDDVSKEAAKIVACLVALKPDCVLGLATGSTPIGMYDYLAKLNSRNVIDFKEVKSFNLDEYYPISADNDQSYHYFMEQNLFSKINIDRNNTHILDGKCKDAEKECADFEDMIKAAGGIDIQILGIGENGHIGFNEPDASLFSKTHITDLTESTIEANSRFFDSVDEVPKQAITMGIGTILNAKKIIIIACGSNKHRIVNELLSAELRTDIPATMLKVHPDVVLICDKAAYASSRIGIDIGGSFMKFCVLSDKNEIIYKDLVSQGHKTEEALIKAVSDKCNEICEKFKISGIGIGTPGTIVKGKVSAINLPLNNTPLAKLISEKTGLSVRISNDANCAAFGEAKAGAGEEADNIIMITLGTGVGGGIIIDNKIYEGMGNAGEIGHMCIVPNGRKCSCGKSGCFEQYASVTALINSAIKAAGDNEDSILANLYRENGEMNGLIFFEAVKSGCPVADKVFEEYLDYLAIGIDNLSSIFNPDMIILSGGITNAGDIITDGIKKRLKSDVTIKIAKLKNEAGMVGAALLQ